MIRIRYKDFSAGTRDLAGLYGKAEGCARAATVYLLPGLAAWQRRAVIRRLRQEASRGFGPPLPQPQLTVALGVDRVRTAARIVTAIVRLHPAVTLLPSALVVVMMTLFVVASGGRPGIASGARGGLADAAAVSGSTARQGAWYVCPQVVTATPWPPRDGQLGDGQLACRRPAPHTAHLPGPLDFAW